MKLSDTTRIAALIPQVPGTAEMTEPFGKGATGWTRHQPAASGLTTVEPASIGIVWHGSEYNVYEPVSGTFAACVGDTVPKGASVAALVGAWRPYNPNWSPGMGLVVPNSENAPTFP